MLLIRRFRKYIVAISAFQLMVSILHAQNMPAVKDSVMVIETNVPEKGVTVTGTVTDATTRKSIAGIRVQVENFSAAITDSTGQFKLQVPSYTSAVTVEGEGYNTRRVALKGRRSIAIALLDDEHKSFSEKVTTPLGIKSKTDVTAAVEQYNVNSGWAQPNETPDAILQGRIAGLYAIRRSGSPGVGANLFLRGYNSLYGTNKPLIVVDNMLFDANDYGQSIIANNYTNPLALIDMKDVDNITVLKDATAIYGTKGANGAIIITTAKAKTQATKIDFATYAGFNEAPKNLPVMDAADYRIYLNEILQTKGMSSSAIQAEPYMNDDPQNPQYARYHYNTDWQKKVMESSINQSYFLKVTGGDNIATYGLSMGFTRNSGIIKETDITRYNTRFNADFNFTRKFTGAANLSFTYNEQNLKDQGIADNTAPLYLSLVKAPFLHNRELNEKGVESPNLSERDTLGITNPSAIIEGMQAYNKFYRFFGTFQFNYEISTHFKASSLIGVVYDKVREDFFVPRKGITDDTLSNDIAQSRMGTQVKRLFTIYNDTWLAYNTTVNNKHNINARLGIRNQINKAEQRFGRSFNSATDDLVSVQSGSAALRQVGGGIGNWNWMNIYLGIDYGFKSKLFLTLHAAVDGSSRFGDDVPDGIRTKGKNLAIMPSVGAAWLISSENFMARSTIDILKLRVTYSMTGNDDIGNYNNRRTYISQNLLGAQGLVRSGIGNPALGWENVRKLNAGFDLAFWNERVSLSVDAFRNETDNMLVYQPLSTISGFTATLTNGGKMRNNGVEATLNVRVVNGRNFKWDAGLNAGQFRNRIIEIPNDGFITEYAGASILTYEGLTATQFYGYTTNGVYGTNAEAAAIKKPNADGSYSNFKGGDVRFVDLDGNNIIDESDRQVIGDPSPDITGGYNNRFIWKNFELNTLFTFSYGNDIFNYLRYRLESGSGVENQLVSVNNRWRGEGHITNTPRASWGDPMGNSRFSDRWIEDGSYIRLRSLSLQYNWPVKRSVFLKSIAVYAIANNVFTLTEYKGYDPEFSVTPSVFSQGIDTGLDPQFRSVTLGVRLGL
ncbi:MAG: SusC/RagA family TonB-linked outer membrane protein [Chitinophagaceae bacterium]|nr:SusC/RagA family TonB-linked outer membrane protein [Chitinophagaceae bacterium]